jgi:hypothetical protein
LKPQKKANAKPVLAVAEKRGTVKMIDVGRWADFEVL